LAFIFWRFSRRLRRRSSSLRRSVFLCFAMIDPFPGTSHQASSPMKSVFCGTDPLDLPLNGIAVTRTGNRIQIKKAGRTGCLIAIRLLPSGVPVHTGAACRPTL
jgi:hypothetical protein